MTPHLKNPKIHENKNYRESSIKHVYVTSLEILVILRGYIHLEI